MLNYMSFCYQLAWKRGSFIGQLLLALIFRYLFLNVKMETIYVPHHSPSLIRTCFLMQNYLAFCLTAKKVLLKEEKKPLHHVHYIRKTVLRMRFFLYIKLGRIIETKMNTKT